MEKEVYSITLKEGLQVGVTKEIYDTYMRDQWRAEKYDKVWRTRCISYEGAMKEQYDFDRGFSNFENPVEEAVVKNIRKEFLRKILRELTMEEKDLLISLLLYKEGERVIGERMGISKTTVRYRREKLIQYLRDKFQEEFENSI